MDKKWILSRARERSTWIGITALLTGIGVTISGEISDVIVSLGMGFSGLIAMLTGDK